MDFDPARADYVENRLDEIKSLKRKYGNSVEDVLRYCEDAKRRSTSSPGRRRTPARWTAA